MVFIFKSGGFGDSCCQEKIVLLYAKKIDSYGEKDEVV